MLVKLIVGDKTYQVTDKMANATITLAKEKYLTQNVNAIVAIKKGDMVVLQDDVYEDTVAFEQAINNWKHSGYKCYYTKKDEEK